MDIKLTERLIYLLEKSNQGTKDICEKLENIKDILIDINISLVRIDTRLEERK